MDIRELESHMGQLMPNIVITVDQGWNGAGQYALMANTIVDVHFNGATQALPRFLYQEHDGKLKRIDAISPHALEHFGKAYDKEINADELFFYIYGLLHHPDYLQKYKNNLRKELPRIPRVKTWEQFQMFAGAGYKLGWMHCNFEEVKGYDGVEIKGLESENFYVKKLRYRSIPGKRGDAAMDRACIIYNEDIIIDKIPLEAQEYVVNNKPALDWIMKCAGVRVDKESGIVNDFNRYAMEHNKPRYILDLILSVITISLETMRIIRMLPPFEIHPLDQPR